jgi:diguanylate cyclase (GGDEF)-like protein
MRLAKHLAHAGVASRRAAEAMIAAGRVTVDGATVTDPARDVTGAEAIAERMRVRLDGRVMIPERDLRVTASIGCAALDAADHSASAWIGRADRALYRAKAAGRDRTVRGDVGKPSSTVLPFRMPRTPR